MDKNTITFDQLPLAVHELSRKVDHLATLLSGFTSRGNEVPQDTWMSVEELSAYLPGKPAVTTLYGKVQRREIPFKRMGKRLVFLRTEIDQYLKGQHRKTEHGD